MKIQTHNARKSDPASSHMAAERVRRSPHRQTQIDILVNFVRENPGLTSREIAVALQNPGIDRYAAARRLADANGLLVKQGPMRRCTACKSMPWCVTWYPIEHSGVASGR